MLVKLKTIEEEVVYFNPAHVRNVHVDQDGITCITMDHYVEFHTFKEDRIRNMTFEMSGSLESVVKKLNKGM